MVDEKRSLGSDNHSGIHPKALEALIQANSGHAHSYGKDEWTQKSAFKRMRKAQEASQSLKQPTKKVRNSKTHESIPEYEESKARTEHLKAELLELDRKQKEQLLVSAAEVKNSWAQIISLARTKVLGIPSKAKQRIPDLDTSAMTCLEDIVRESLEDLANSELETA